MNYEKEKGWLCEEDRYREMYEPIGWHEFKTWIEEWGETKYWEPGEPEVLILFDNGLQRVVSYSDVFSAYDISLEQAEGFPLDKKGRLDVAMKYWRYLPDPPREGVTFEQNNWFKYGEDPYPEEQEEVLFLFKSGTQRVMKFRQSKADVLHYTLSKPWFFGEPEPFDDEVMYWRHLPVPPREETKC